MKILALIPAHNEANSIGMTIETLLAQSVPFSNIVVIPNGCTDNTADVARTYPVTVLEFPERLDHLKCEALNKAWLAYGQDAELIVTVDADTELEPDAVAKWLKEFRDPLLAGSQAKFTMRGKKLLTRLQKAEYALGIDRSLKKGRTTILAGASSCYRNRYLMRVMEIEVRLAAERKEKWNHALNGSTPDKKTATASSGSEIRSGSSTDGSGLKLTDRSLKDSSSAIDATTLLASDSITFNSARSLTTSGTEMSEVTSGTVGKHTANVVVSTTTPGQMADASVVPAMHVGSESTAPAKLLDEPPVGPWSYESAVEDFCLTYRLRAMNLRCIVSPTIRAYTDAMPNMKALRGQRLKWQTGTVEDIIRFGFNKYTWTSWTQQIVGLLLAVITVAWISLLGWTLAHGGAIFSLHSWWTIIPMLSALVNVKNALRIPERDWIDIVIGGTLVVGEIYGMIRLVWMVTAWHEVLWSKVTKKRKDRWQMQGMAEGIYDRTVIDSAQSAGLPL